MKSFIILVILIVCFNISFGQKIFRSDNDAYKVNGFTYEFFIYNDSTCFLRGKSNSTYILYKGLLNKISDTVYLFNYQPVVIFGSNKRFDSNDSVTFNTHQIDTSMALNPYIVTVGSNTKPVDIIEERTTVFIKGIDKQKFSIDTKFIDPLIKKKVFITIKTNSEPDLTYYGSKTPKGSVRLTIIKNKLTLFPDHNHFTEKHTFVLIN